MDAYKIIMILLAVALILGTSAFVIITDINKNKPKQEGVPIVLFEVGTPVITEEDGEEFIWQDNKDINRDYMGQLVFESGLINEPIVQTYDGIYKDNGVVYSFYSENGNFINSANVGSDGCDGRACNGNDVYLRLNWKTHEYDFWGSNFMDYRNTLNDQNIIIYGHHASRAYYGDAEAEKIRFTKLDCLLEKDNYEANKSFSFILENEIRKYEVAYVLQINAENNDDIQVYRTYINIKINGEDDPGFFNTYLKLLKDKSLYDTGVELKENDKLMTLSLCIQGQPTQRQIIIAKEVSRRKI